MLAYIGKRLLLMIPTLIGVVTLVFVIIQFVPGGPIEQLLAEARAGSGGDTGSYTAKRDVDKKQIEDLKKLYGFDKPLHVRYFEMLGNFATFDLGKSFLRNQDVWTLIKSKLPVSISLGLWTFLVSYLISIPLGVAKAVREGSTFDTFTTVLVLIGFAIPGFVLGILLIVLFAGGSFLDWFPLRGLTSDHWRELGWAGRIGDYFWHITLPIVALLVGGFATLTMLTKNSFLEEINKQYVTTARSKGLTKRRVLYGHVFRNAMLLVVAGFPAAFVGILFTSALLIEVIFSLDGLGLLGFEAAINRDYPIMFGTLYIYTIVGLFLTLISDLTYVAVDPRIDFASRET